MRLETSGFGSIAIDGHCYDHDVVIDCGRVKKRKKKPSKVCRNRYGHTPLSAEENIPWGSKQLVIGTGYHGSLPIMDEVCEEAERRGVTILALTLTEACRHLEDIEEKDICAVLHTTC